jgi:hypothetical protein
MRQRKDNVIIRYRQEFLLSALEPCLVVTLVAFGTFGYSDKQTQNKPNLSQNKPNFCTIGSVYCL